MQSLVLSLCMILRQKTLSNMDVIVKGSPNIEVGFSTKVIKVGAVDSDGRYPDMSVGFADDLVGRGESVPAEFSFRASGGKSIKDGAARIKRLKGNSVVWNQHLEKKYLSSGSNNIITDGGIPKGHKFAIIRSVADNECYYIPSEGIYYYALAPGEDAKIMTNNHDVDTSYVRAYAVGESGYVQIIDLTKMFQAGNEPTTIEEYYARKPIVEDEYAYNEGEVIHMTAEGIKSVGDNAWDEEWENGTFNTSSGEDINYGDPMGQVRSKYPIHVLPDAEYYATVGDSMLWIMFLDKNGSVIENPPHDGEIVGNSINISKRGKFKTPANAAFLKFYCTIDYGSTYNHDILISLYHSGWKQDTDAGYQPYWEDRLIFDQRIKYEFPDGMSKWDMAYNKNNKGHVSKGMRVVDLGSLNWYYDASLGGYYSDMLVGVKKLFDGICAKYPFVGDYRNVTDKTCGCVYEECVLVKDSSYTDAASLKASLAGVPLFYELAEPTIIEYDEPFNLDYRVADFGTEQAITEQPSAPISVDIIYQFNAVDMIREHEIEIAELQTIIATMQAQLASLTSNNE